MPPIRTTDNKETGIGQQQPYTTAAPGTDISSANAAFNLVAQQPSVLADVFARRAILKQAQAQAQAQMQAQLQAQLQAQAQAQVQAQAQAQAMATAAQPALAALGLAQVQASAAQSLTPWTLDNYRLLATLNSTPALNLHTPSAPSLSATLLATARFPQPQQDTTSTTQQEIKNLTANLPDPINDVITIADNSSHNRSQRSEILNELATPLDTISGSARSTSRKTKIPPRLEAWNTMFDRLVAYKEKHGDCSVPQRYKLDTKLGNWVHHQRVSLAQGSLSDDRKKKLESIGFGWTVNDKWAVMFERLQAYKKEHGDCVVPCNYELDPKLGRWVDNQRQQRSKQRKVMSPERIKLLDSIGFVWNVDLQTLWNTMFARLCRFKEREGHANVPIAYEKDPQLGRWVDKQRSRKKYFGEDCIRKFDEIDFEW
mmetsp:Transcript_71/g.145  ORF Transcript_71/g.145 Transcript_71/m.145 type:complete len:428 (-) Transcript_71:265-1548(-)